MRPYGRGSLRDGTAGRPLAVPRQGRPEDFRDRMSRTGPWVTASPAGGPRRALRTGRGFRGPGTAVRLTGRGAVLSLFGLSFLGLIMSDWLSWGILADGTFIAACIAIACYAKPSDLLTVAVSPPLAFFAACVCAKAATSAGVTSAAEGMLVELANSAPWLFTGTALTVGIALYRGLPGNMRELRQDLQGTPDASPRDGTGGRPRGSNGGSAPGR